MEYAPELVCDISLFKVLLLGKLAICTICIGTIIIGMKLGSLEKKYK
jgi:hypothetical protein